MIKKFLIFLYILALTACGGDDGSSSKNIFSLWHDTADDTPLDLTGGDFGVDLAFSIWAGDGSPCNCDLRFIGNQSSGNYILNSCYYVSGSGSGDPGCNALNQTGTYTNSSGTLTTCDSSMDCDTYK